MNNDLKPRMILAAACVGVAVIIWPSSSRFLSSEWVPGGAIRDVLTFGTVCLQTSGMFWMINRNQWFGRFTAWGIGLFLIIGSLSATLAPDKEPWLYVQLAVALFSLLTLLRFLAMRRP